MAAVTADLEASIGVDPNVVARFEKLSHEVGVILLALAQSLMLISQLETLRTSVLLQERVMGRAKQSMEQILVSAAPDCAIQIDRNLNHRRNSIPLSLPSSMWSARNSLRPLNVRMRFHLFARLNMRIRVGVGCTGEVRIDRVEGDFAAWGIHILVSYRDGDSLQILTGSLQSGGVNLFLAVRMTNSD